MLRAWRGLASDQQRSLRGHALQHDCDDLEQTAAAVIDVASTDSELWEKARQSIAGGSGEFEDLVGAELLDEVPQGTGHRRIRQPVTAELDALP